jgi:hypothetical protein
MSAVMTQHIFPPTAVTKLETHAAPVGMNPHAHAAELQRCVTEVQEAHEELKEALSFFKLKRNQVRRSRRRLDIAARNLAAKCQEQSQHE